MVLYTVAAEVDQIAVNFSAMTLPELLDASSQLRTFETDLADEPPSALAEVTMLKVTRILDALERQQVVKRLHIREAEDSRTHRDTQSTVPAQAMAMLHPERAGSLPEFSVARPGSTA